MERLYGVPLTDLAAIRSVTSADPEATLTAALNTWFGSLLGCSTFHADVHAGQPGCGPFATCSLFLPLVLCLRHSCVAKACKNAPTVRTVFLLM